MSKNTMIELAQELEARNTPDGRYDELISEAKAGEFHDYKNEKYLCGKLAFVAIVSDKFPELKDLADQVKNGDYDEQMDEEDKKKMRSDLKSDGMSAKDKPGYQPLPALKIDSPEGEVISCWKMSFKERLKVYSPARRNGIGVIR